MSAPAEPTKESAGGSPESPTTARPLEMDDDDVQEAAPLGGSSAPPTPAKDFAPQTLASQPATNEEEDTPPTPPAKPPRPLTEAHKNEMILKEAFPTVDDAVIKAVLSASGGRVEPAFNALLEMTDPDALKNDPAEVPPPQPPRPQGRAQISQLEADELYARQLADHYNNVGEYEARTSNRNAVRGQGFDGEREHSFMDDDLPVIQENLRKGFAETQTKVNGWITGIRKRLEEQFDESGQPGQGSAQGRQRYGEHSRPSGDYDADPQVLGDDFAGMRLGSDGAPMGRTGTNPSVYRPPPKTSSPRPGDGRRVGFKDEAEEINMYDSSPVVPPKDAPSSGAKASKWQPLSTMDPSPIGDNDPFSLGDSEDEKEAKDKPKEAKTGELDDAEMLKQAAAEAMSDSLVDSSKEGDSSAKKS